MSVSLVATRHDPSSRVRVRAFARVDDRGRRDELVRHLMAVVPGRYRAIEGDGRCIATRIALKGERTNDIAREDDERDERDERKDDVGRAKIIGRSTTTTTRKMTTQKTWNRRDLPRNAKPRAFVMDCERREVVRERVRWVGPNVVRYAAICQEGCYPNKDNHVNQDCYVVAEREEMTYVSEERDRNEISSYGNGVCGELLLGVFDGHGKRGEDCAQIACGHFTATLVEETNENEGLDVSYKRAFEKVNGVVCKIMGEEASFSGSTAITALFDADGIVRVGNVGDSRCVIGVQVEKSDSPTNRHTKTWNVLDLTHDQTCFRADERARMKAEAEKPMMFATIGMVLGETPSHEDFGDGEPGSDDEYCDDPPRVFMAGYRFPGCAFTRSIGDTVGKALGVSATPEMSTHDLNASPSTQCIVIASDGVFEFMSSAETMAIAERHYLAGGDGSSERAAEEIVRVAYTRWQDQDERADDVTAIVAFIYPNESNVVATIQLDDVQKTMGALYMS